MLCFRRASYDVLKKKLKLLRYVDIALAWFVFFGFIFFCAQKLIFNHELESYTSSSYFGWDCLLVVHFWLCELSFASSLRSVIEKHNLCEYKFWFWMRILMEVSTISLFLLGVFEGKRTRVSNFGLLKITLSFSLIPYRIYELLLLKDFRKYIGTIEVSPTPADAENPRISTFSNGDGGDATQVPLPDQNKKIASFLRGLANTLER